MPGGKLISDIQMRKAGNSAARNPFFAARPDRRQRRELILIGGVVLAALIAVDTALVVIAAGLPL